MGHKLLTDKHNFTFYLTKHITDKTFDEGNVNILNVCKCLEVFSNSKDFKSHTFSRMSPVQKTELLKTGLVSHHTSSHC